MEITCYRNAELVCEQRHLPAATYNLALTQLARTEHGCLFVPIRRMQYMAILDDEEFVFIDGERKCWVDISWRRFKPQERATLDDPVAYEAAYYLSDADQLMLRLLAEFPRALQELAGKELPHGPASVIKFPSGVSR